MRLHWHTFAGGTAAASDKCSYAAYPSLGSYHIDPVSSKYDVERHIGYVVRFANTYGKISGGLWHDLAPSLVDLATAKRLCNEHQAKHAASVIPSPDILA